jgi:putative effector of murein hydrolase
MKLENFAFMMGIIVGILIGFVSGIIYQVHTAHAFNMTEDLEKESRLLGACITFNLELDACNEIYGGTENSMNGTISGEAIK